MGLHDENQLYSLCKSKVTGEWHVFLSHLDKNDKCYISSQTSICGAMKFSDKETCIITCVTEEGIKIAAAKLDENKNVCGNCMKTLFKTEDD